MRGSWGCRYLCNTRRLGPHRDALREGAAAEAEERQPIVDAGIGAILTVVEKAVVRQGERVDNGERVRSNDLAHC